MPIVLPTSRFSRSTHSRPLSWAVAGFSLLELLLVMTLVPIVFFAVYANFSTGIRLWQRLQVDTPEEDVLIFTQKARRDFENVMRYSPIPFEGEKNEATFPTGIESGPALGGHRAMGEVRYFYEENAKAIFRETKNISQAYRQSEGTKDRILKNVSAFSIGYLTFDKLENAYVWNENFRPSKQGELPVAIRLSYSLSEKNENVEQVFFIPVGGFLK